MYSSPYAPPQSPYQPPAQYAYGAAPSAQNGTAAIYTPNQMVLATFLGSPVAGAILLAINEQRLGRPNAVLPTIGAGILASAALITLAAVLPDNFPGMPISLLGIGMVRVVAQLRQAERIAQYHGWGGRKASSWAAAGIGLVGASMIVLGIVAYAIVSVGAEELTGSGGQ